MVTGNCRRVDPNGWWCCCLVLLVESNNKPTNRIRLGIRRQESHGASITASHSGQMPYTRMVECEKRGRDKVVYASNNQATAAVAVVASPSNPIGRTEAMARCGSGVPSCGCYAVPTTTR